ncbi:Carcinine transporter [Frankliniella fusca]|uniref:Carcinine transporter n=1 Tax=Frankliniella fusca TaxID=407009 RepID=A0AAE1H1B4_9NEOP|nr:Carcinine transporter [Frankliniella fusca]
MLASGRSSGRWALALVLAAAAAAVASGAHVPDGAVESNAVLSLNLTNLVILLVLKAIIFGAGHMGVGWAAKSSRGGESAGPAPLVTEQEALLLLGFLMGGQGGPGGPHGPHNQRVDRDGYQCLNRVACQEPEAANSYARAGILLSNGAKLLNGVIPYDPKYDHIVEGLVDAVEYGRRGERCDLRYSCARR